MEGWLDMLEAGGEERERRVVAASIVEVEVRVWGSLLSPFGKLAFWVSDPSSGLMSVAASAS